MVLAWFCLKDISIGQFLQGIALSKDNRYLYITAGGASQLYVLQLSNMNFMANVSVGSGMGLVSVLSDYCSNGIWWIVP